MYCLISKKCFCSIGKDNNDSIWQAICGGEEYDMSVGDQNVYPNFSAIFHPKGNLKGNFQCSLAMKTLDNKTENFSSNSWNANNGMSLQKSIHMIVASIAWTMLLQILQ